MSSDTYGCCRPRIECRKICTWGTHEKTTFCAVLGSILYRFASSKLLNSRLNCAVQTVTKTSEIGKELTLKRCKLSFFHVSLMYIFSCTQFWVCSTHKCLKTSRWDNYEFRACIWGVFWGVCAGLGHAWNAQIPPLSLSSPCSRKRYLKPSPYM